VIASFGDAVTEEIYDGRTSSRTRRFGPDVLSAVKRKLDMIEAAHILAYLKAPPGNRLEALKGDWKGFRSIRVNDPWRIVFRWEEGLARDVTLADYH
jgi:proteic killer suppression protein